jgi:hypothetical protein
MPPITCAECGSLEIISTVVTMQFQYGEAVLEATFPMRNCVRCDCEFRDEVSEAAIEAAIKVYELEVQK